MNFPTDILLDDMGLQPDAATLMKLLYTWSSAKESVIFRLLTKKRLIFSRNAGETVYWLSLIPARLLYAD